ncbi:MAG: hypothetical protein ACFFAO_08720 [Candidatus Hermodarchaeota archaeon]
MSEEQKPSENNELEEEREELNSNQEDFNFNLYKLDLQSEEFEEIELDSEISIDTLLNPDNIMLFVDPQNSRVWIWEGAKTTTKMKFISAQRAPFIRDKCGIDFNITTVDDGDEPFEFKRLIGLEIEID